MQAAWRAAFVELWGVVCFAVPTFNLLLCLVVARLQCSAGQVVGIAQYEQHRVYDVVSSAALLLTRGWYTSEVHGLFTARRARPSPARSLARRNFTVGSAAAYALLVDCVVMTWTFARPSICDSDADLALGVVCDTVPTDSIISRGVYTANVAIMLVSVPLVVYAQTDKEQEK